MYGATQTGNKVGNFHKDAIRSNDLIVNYTKTFDKEKLDNLKNSTENVKFFFYQNGINNPEMMERITLEFQQSLAVFSTKVSSCLNQTPQMEDRSFILKQLISKIPEIENETLDRMLCRRLSYSSYHLFYQNIFAVYDLENGDIVRDFQPIELTTSVYLDYSKSQNKIMLKYSFLIIRGVSSLVKIDPVFFVNFYNYLQESRDNDSQIADSQTPGENVYKVIKIKI